MNQIFPPTDRQSGNARRGAEKGVAHCRLQPPEQAQGSRGTSASGKGRRNQRFEPIASGHDVQRAIWEVDAIG